jgi:glycosyltransferase involved in cell wall biosynthesis
MQIIKSSLLVDNPLVSVVIPSYNRVDTVGETINSIIRQKCNFEFEIVIGDDCSTDHSREVLLQYQAKYPQNIVLLFHETNVGLGANWAICAMYCRGRYLANCDNDDFWHNQNKLQLQVDFLASHPEYGVVHSDYRELNRKNGRIVEVVFSDFVQKKPIQKSFFDGKFKVCNATVMYKKELIDKYVNLNDFIEHQFTLQDWIIWVIVSRHADFYCLPVSTATVGIENESITRPKDYDTVKLRFQKERECCIYLASLFPQDLYYDEQKYTDYIHSILLNLAFRQMDYSKAKEFGNRLPYNSIKVFCSQYKLLFLLFALCKKMKVISSSGFDG